MRGGASRYYLQTRRSFTPRPAQCYNHRGASWKGFSQCPPLTSLPHGKHPRKGWRATSLSSPLGGPLGPPPSPYKTIAHGWMPSHFYSFLLSPRLASFTTQAGNPIQCQGGLAHSKPEALETIKPQFQAGCHAGAIFDDLRVTLEADWGHFGHWWRDALAVTVVVA